VIKKVLLNVLNIQDKIFFTLVNCIGTQVPLA
jgi:hypothetical protein